MRAPAALPAMVVEATPCLSGAEHFYIGGVHIHGHRPGQRLSALRGQQPDRALDHLRRSGFDPGDVLGGEPPGQPGSGRGSQKRYRRHLGSDRIGADLVQTDQ